MPSNFCRISTNITNVIDGLRAIAMREQNIDPLPV